MRWGAVGWLVARPLEGYKIKDKWRIRSSWGENPTFYFAHAWNFLNCDYKKFISADIIYGKSISNNM